MKIWSDWPIKTITKVDFPEQLKKINNCPIKLFYRGEWNDQIFQKSVAVVGSRRMSQYGERIIEKILPAIIREKITIISGFMYGIDTKAHQTCIDFGGKTIAVLGGGLNVLTPIENEKLYSQILDTGGIVISEYESDFKPTLWSFPQRNRIVSGLSTKGVVVVEAGLKSGSLITARLGRQQGREVWAVPGPIDSKTSEGCNWLIQRNEAKILISVEQLTETKMIQENLFEEQKLNKKQKMILELIDNNGSSADELCRKAKVTVSELTVELTLMTFENLVEERNGKYYRKS